SLGSNGVGELVERAFIHAGPRLILPCLELLDLQGRRAGLLLRLAYRANYLCIRAQQGVQAPSQPPGLLRCHRKSPENVKYERMKAASGLHASCAGQVPCRIPYTPWRLWSFCRRPRRACRDWVLLPISPCEAPVS